MARPPIRLTSSYVPMSTVTSPQNVQDYTILRGSGTRDDPFLCAAHKEYTNLAAGLNTLAFELTLPRTPTGFIALCAFNIYYAGALPDVLITPGWAQTCSAGAVSNRLTGPSKATVYATDWLSWTEDEMPFVLSLAPTGENILNPASTSIFYARVLYASAAATDDAQMVLLFYLWDEGA